MKDQYFDEFLNSFNDSENNQNLNTEETKDASEVADNGYVRAEQTAEESSYEWNAERGYQNGEYHYSYINGANSDAPHNPNNYEDSYSSSAQPADSYQEDTSYSARHADSYQDDTSYSAPQSDIPYGAQSYSDNYGGYTAAPQHSQKAPKAKKEKKGASRGFVAAALAIAILGSTAIGFGGGYLLTRNQDSGTTTTSGGLTIKQVASDKNNTDTTNAVSSTVNGMTTSDIVKKTANSVVEIFTEGTVTGSFARQYVTQGAGSGVIISEDGYIVTNHHVIDGANKLTVTLRDGTSYDAQLIGSDEENDIALIKIDASGLTAATFGNSSDLVVGDYVVAIGNPLGTLGGTVTDGIISALAREVTIEGQNMTLLQTNAQISPGNSGGGLFNANGELVGIVNAKDSATEVEGIAFAIPVNNVVNIIKDLKDYGYVTGKISTGMQFVDINSYDSAFYYNVNQLGVYVLSVDSGSNAEAAGFTSGDLITAVNGTEVSSSSEIDKALENSKVGDKVTFTVSRRGQSTDIQLTLAEYTPSVKPNSSDSESLRDYQSNDNLWKQLLDW